MARKPRVLVACASFKGTLSSREAGEALAQGLRKIGCVAEVVALADGGEGLVEALARAVPGSKLKSARVRGPLAEKRRAIFALLPKSKMRKRLTAVIEMAASSGLPLVPEKRRDPLVTTTLGVGDQIKAALDAGAQEILLGIGGSATNDGGAGMAQALGARLFDAQGDELPPGGGALANLACIKVNKLDPRLKRVRVTVACDVTNPLCGPLGASAVYGPQKGATKKAVKQLDAALLNFARVVGRDLKKNVARVPGAGASGGLGAGCLAFLNARLVRGIELVLNAVDFDARLKGADLAITGEGGLDRQTLMGKAPAGVAARAKKAGVPCIAVGGGIEAAARPGLRRTFKKIESLSEFAGSGKAARARGAHFLTQLAAQHGKAWLAK